MAAPSRRTIPLSEHLYRLLLQCYPRKFRRDFCEEMMQTFRDCYREACSASGRSGILPFWGLMLYDFAITALTEHRRALASRLKRLFFGQFDDEFLKEIGGRTLVAQFHLHFAQQTDKGVRRPNNEDSMTSVVPEDPQILAQKGALFVVADGLGGDTKGEVASQMAVDTVRRVYYSDSNGESGQALRHAVLEANAALRQMQNGMGTTCVAAVLQGTTLYVANVGDSRAYIVRGTEIHQVTEDHSWVAQQIREGQLTQEQARTHEKRNLIYRCLGTDNAEADLFTQEVQDGDALVLCTDGLSGVVTDEELLTIVNQFGPQESVTQLISRANEQGGPDNITAIVVRVSLDEPSHVSA